MIKIDKTEKATQKTPNCIEKQGFSACSGPIPAILGPNFRFSQARVSKSDHDSEPSVATVSPVLRHGFGFLAPSGRIV
jgi:hypothetical protein